MRVIAGKFKGRQLRAPRGRSVRPTADRVKEALFSILGERVAGAYTLDLFAGSGALGIEALSRGAAGATFVDKSRTAIATIKANLAAVAVEAQVYHEDALKFLSWSGKEGRTYNLVFLDPPYAELKELAELLGEALPGILAANAIVVCESAVQNTYDLKLHLNYERDERRYGDTLISIYGPRAKL